LKFTLFGVRRHASMLPELADRERDISHLMAQDCTTPEIVAKLAPAPRPCVTTSPISSPSCKSPTAPRRLCGRKKPGWGRSFRIDRRGFRNRAGLTENTAGRSLSWLALSLNRAKLHTTKTPTFVEAAGLVQLVGIVARTHFSIYRPLASTRRGGPALYAFKGV